MALFALAYSSHLLWYWPLGKTWYHHTFLSSAPLSQGLPILPDIFSMKGIMEPALLGDFDCPPAWSYPQVFNSGWGWGYMKKGLVFDKELFSCRIFGISKLFQTQKSFWHRFKANSFWRNSSDSYGEVFRCDENFLFWFFGEKYEVHEVTSGWSQKVEISIWGLLRTVFWRRCEEHEVTSGWSQNVEISIWGFLRTVFQSIHFICMNNDFVSHEKALPTNPDCLPLIRKGLIRHVM
jgi:hypothetical protein